MASYSDEPLLPHGPPAPPYWPLYHDEVYHASDRRAELCEALLAFFSTAPGAELLGQARRAWCARLLAPPADTQARQLGFEAGAAYSLPLDYRLWRESVPVPDLFAALEMAPAEAFTCLAAASHAAAFLAPGAPAAFPHLHPAPPGCRVHVRLHNHPASRTPFRGVSAGAVGTLLTVRGTVIRASAVTPLLTSLAYACAKCGARSRRATPDGVAPAPPGRCGVDGCKGAMGALSDGARGRDSQRLRLQETQRRGSGEAEEEEEARVPRALDVELSDALCASAAVGDDVTICGIVKARREASRWECIRL